MGALSVSSRLYLGSLSGRRNQREALRRQRGTSFALYLTCGEWGGAGLTEQAEPLGEWRVQGAREDSPQPCQATERDRACPSLPRAELDLVRVTKGLVPARPPREEVRGCHVTGPPFTGGFHTAQEMQLGQGVPV